MAYTPHVKVTMSGSLYTSEEWACTISYLPNTAPVAADLVELADDVQTAAAAWIGGTNAGWSTAVRLRRVRAAYVGADGRATLIRDSTTPPDVPGVGTPVLPPQIALVHSLRTGLPGRANRGRIYVPQMAVIADPSTGRPDLTSSLVTQATTFWQAVDLITTAGNVFGLIVASNIAAGAPQVTSVLLGNVFDTQRRRRNALVETYTTITL